MILLTPDQTATLRDWFLPDRPGPLVGLHVINTRNGACFADRWPEPRAIWSEVAGNGSFAGDPGAFSPDDLKDRVAGFVEAPEPFEPLLRAAFSSIHVWDRVVLDLQTAPRHCEPRRGEAISQQIFSENDVRDCVAMAPRRRFVGNYALLTMTEEEQFESQSSFYRACPALVGFWRRYVFQFRAYLFG